MQTELVRSVYWPRGLVLRGQSNKQLVLYLFTGKQNTGVFKPHFKY